MRHELKVNRAELAEGLRKLRKGIKRKTKMDAVLTFENGNLVLFLDGVQIEATAQGEFPGMVRIHGIKVLNLFEVLPMQIRWWWRMTSSDYIWEPSRCPAHGITWIRTRFSCQWILRLQYY